MRRTIFKTSWLTLWRDRPAFALTFLLPPVIYAIFALVFSSASGGDLTVRLAVHHGQDRLSERLVEKLEQTPEVTSLIMASSKDDINAIIRQGKADVGLAIVKTDKPAPDFILYTEGTRQAASLTAEKALARLKPDDNKGASLTRQLINPVNATAPTVAYYAGGVAMLFLFLSGFQSCLGFFDERDAGVYDRIALSRLGLAPVIDGKLAFLITQSIAQIAIILATAFLIFGVDLSYAPLLLGASLFASAICVSGLTIVITLLCQSRAEANALGVIVALVLAALGGSMAPTFLMPPSIQTIGAVTPNALGLKAFGAALWTGGGWSLAAPALMALTSIGILGWIAARILVKRLLQSD